MRLKSILDWQIKTSIVILLQAKLNSLPGGSATSWQVRSRRTGPSADLATQDPGFGPTLNCSQWRHWSRRRHRPQSDRPCPRTVLRTASNWVLSFPATFRLTSNCSRRRVTTSSSSRLRASTPSRGPRSNPCWVESATDMSVMQTRDECWKASRRCRWLRRSLWRSSTTSTMPRSTQRLLESENDYFPFHKKTLIYLQFTGILAAREHGTMTSFDNSHTQTIN